MKTKFEAKHWAMLIAIILLFLFAAWLQDAPGDEVEDQYVSEYENYYEDRVIAHEQLGEYEELAIAIDIYPSRRVIAVLFEDSAIDATDSGCQQFGKMAKFITRDGWVLVVLNKGWIPSTRCIIDQGLAAKLAAGY